MLGKTEDLDRTSFSLSGQDQTIAVTHGFSKDHQAGLRGNTHFTWVADLAFYTIDALRAYDSVVWIARVPETVKACRQCVTEIWRSDGYL